MVVVNHPRPPRGVRYVLCETGAKFAGGLLPTGGGSKERKWCPSAECGRGITGRLAPRRVQRLDNVLRIDRYRPTADVCVRARAHVFMGLNVYVHATFSSPCATARLLNNADHRHAPCACLSPPSAEYNYGPGWREGGGSFIHLGELPVRELPTLSNTSR